VWREIAVNGMNGKNFKIEAAYFSQFNTLTLETHVLMQFDVQLALHITRSFTVL
jgi:hypothetical protein